MSEILGNIYDRSMAIVFGNIFFSSFWKLFDKKFLKFFYLYFLFIQKTAELVLKKNFRNSGVVSHKNLSDPSLSNIFNLLSIGLRYILSLNT